MRVIPVEERASWFDLGRLRTSPKAVIVTGPLIPLLLMAEVMDWDSLKALAVAGRVHLSKSHQTATLTERESSSWWWRREEEEERVDPEGEVVVVVENELVIDRRGGRRERRKRRDFDGRDRNLMVGGVNRGRRGV